MQILGASPSPHMFAKQILSPIAIGMMHVDQLLTLEETVFAVAAYTHSCCQKSHCQAENGSVSHSLAVTSKQSCIAYHDVRGIANILFQLEPTQISNIRLLL